MTQPDLALAAVVACVLSLPVAARRRLAVSLVERLVAMTGSQSSSSASIRTRK